ncbi:protein of unknown function [Taphrina deformans PYCC 5710]|uniref:Mediator of RNA polymerase II transcription subunit 4 n=1 Tax=Taphrina deformans (strain PYCC 5710 / ATCC 11124 / CBS 356.35 / IMI 108563 / JCM 9778 / NBRC 8474) TaxID=1097556 RepID=R4XH66_TAPDE|nr:protein of unknown function [Taphrina deformans PYCC 5710]|eukprot:CCG85132.1 protein of unknown function [Taphrina deformans PYCC 5710]
MASTTTTQLALQSTLDGYETAIDRLFQVLASAAPSADNNHQPLLDAAIDEVIRQDDSLTPALDEVYQHQQNSKLIAELQETSAALDTRLNEIMSTMTRAHKDLMASIKKTSQEVPLQHDAVEYKMLIKYAERIARFTRTVKSVDQSTTTQNLPWPTEDMMRRGVLATGSINMLKAGDRKTRKNEPDQRQIDDLLNDPTAQVTYKDERDEDGDEQGRGPAAPTDAAALDLDLFDPDEDD